MDTYAERNIEKAIRDGLYVELSDILDSIAHNLDPEDVFPDTALEFWAEANGYIKE